MAVELIGGVSVAILLLTLLQQIIGQWRDRSIVLGPRSLVAGHLLATSGLLAYAVLRHDLVFAAAAALVLLASLLSLVIARHYRSRWRQKSPTRRSDVIPFRPRHVLLKRHGSNR